MTQLPEWIRPLAYVTPLWHGVALCRDAEPRHRGAPGALGHVGYLVAVAVAGVYAGDRTYRRRLYV